MHSTCDLSQGEVALQLVWMTCSMILVQTTTCSGRAHFQVKFQKIHPPLLWGAPTVHHPWEYYQEVMVIKTSAFQLHLSTRLPHWLLHTHVSLRYGRHSTVIATHVTMAVTGVLCWNYWLHPPIVIHPRSIAMVTQHVSVTWCRNKAALSWTKCQTWHGTNGSLLPKQSATCLCKNLGLKKGEGVYSKGVIKHPVVSIF